MKLEQLGPYRIVKRIGRGGMGAVYEAVCDESGPHAGMHVAIKALSPQLAMAEGFRERFEAEIESLKKLKHDGIVRLYGYGEQDGMLFYSMELVEGPSLEDEISNGRRFDWRETLRIGIQICRALKHAHDHGVVHRDIKPANLMLAEGEKVKIADFGIARLFGGTQLTTAGGVLGTADYMSPEQADGRAVTEKCDQYSLGGVLFALLSGRPPFRAKTMPEMLQLQRFAEAEPVLRFAPDTPGQLDRLISQLLAKEPSERFPNVLVLSRHMEAMEKALSRPIKSQTQVGDTTASFAQPALPTSSAPLTAAADDAATRAASAAPVILPQETLEGTAHADLYDAATLDQPLDNPSSTGNSISLIELPPTPDEVVVPSSKTHFTTVDEEARRQHELSRGNRMVIVVQLASLMAALGLLGWGGWHLMRPPTADQLFANIQQAVEVEGVENLSRDAVNGVEEAVEKFSARFPNDPRTPQLQPLREQLEFQAYERQARARAKFTNTADLKPIDSIYFSATTLAEKNPARALGELRALLELYDPENQVMSMQSAKQVTEKFEELGETRLLVLARQRIEQLESRVKEITTTQLPALRERLAKAKSLRQSDPALAQRMYQAVIRLYGDRAWAQDAVRSARGELSNLRATIDENADR